MYYMWLYFLEHLCFSLSKPGSCLDDLWGLGAGECKPELLIYLKVIKLCVMQTACLLLPLTFLEPSGDVNVFVSWVGGGRWKGLFITHTSIFQGSLGLER